MQCMHCKYPESRVVKSFLDDRKNVIKRRRECLRCGMRFTTDEKLRDPIKPDDDRSPHGKTSGAPYF
jgi:transcriptional regulator NrdR family protein